MNILVIENCWVVITNNLGLITRQVLDTMTIFKMTIQQFCDFSEIKTILNLDQFFLRNFDEVSKFLIRESKKNYKNNDDCEIKEYGLTPETILFICIRKFYTELLVNIKTKGFNLSTINTIPIKDPSISKNTFTINNIPSK